MFDYEKDVDVVRSLTAELGVGRGVHQCFALPLDLRLRSAPPGAPPLGQTPSENTGIHIIIGACGTN